MKVLVAGDFCPCERVASAFEKDDYFSVLSEMRDITKQADYSIVNFECPVVEGDAIPINKIGPNLKCTPKGVAAVKYAGFNCVTLANNHFFDFGDKGVRETISSLNAFGVDYVGGGINIEEASQILYRVIGDEKLAIINCCEHEFCIASETKGGSNPLNPVQQFYAIKEARRNADRVLVIIHGGSELMRLPSPRMVETYRFFIDVGADAVVNHHQHCYSGYEVYKGKPIFYGIGNFCFDKAEERHGMWNEGYFVLLNLSKQNVSFTIQPYSQCDDNPMVKILSCDAFNDRITKMNDILIDSKKLNNAIYNHYEKCASEYSNIFEPVMNRFYLAAKRYGWLPSLIGKKRMLTAANYVICESHRDKLIHWLKKNISK